MTKKKPIKSYRHKTTDHKQTDNKKTKTNKKLLTPDHLSQHCHKARQKRWDTTQP